MGTRNRERRKAKEKAREQKARAAANRDQGLTFEAPPSPQEQAQSLLYTAIVAARQGDAPQFERRLDQLVATRAEIVDRVLFATAERDVESLWRHGWQPADLTRIVGRKHTARHVRLIGDLIIAQLRSYAAATIDERWHGQLRALGAEAWWSDDPTYLAEWAAREGIDRWTAVRCAVEVLTLLHSLPVIAVLGPLPGAARADSSRRLGSVSPADERMLGKVRALLAKAESTEFPEEAEAFTAKAQELMARYSIDAALLSAKADRGDQPGGARVSVDAPYEQAKAMLVQQVAEANRCRTVWSGELGFATVLGFPGDVEAVELLYTSLLVQGTTAMVQAGSRQDRYGRSRTRSFRQSFLHAYALRIGERLRGATEEVSQQVAAEEGSGSLLPVLAARDEAVNERFDELFPGIVSHRVRINNVEGWASGTAAADRASLGAPRESISPSVR